MKQGKGHVLGAWTEPKRRDQFGVWIKGDPHPQVVRLVAQGGIQLIQLEMPQVQVTEEVGMHLVGVLTRPRQPETNCYLGVTEEQLSICDSQAEIDREQDLATCAVGVRRR